METENSVLIIKPLEDIKKLKALASEPRIQILALIKEKPLNINEISELLDFPQSTVATHISILEEAGLIVTQNIKARKGTQKICSPSFHELLIQFSDTKNPEDRKNHRSAGHA